MSVIYTPPPVKRYLLNKEAGDSVIGEIGAAPSFFRVKTSLTDCPSRKAPELSLRLKRITRMPVVGEKEPPLLDA